MKIIGATVGTTIPKPNFDQTDPRKGDYIRGDRSFLNAVKTINGMSPDVNGNVQVDIPEGFSGSWNDLTDRPFGEENGPGDTLSWEFDPNAEDFYDTHVVVSDGFVKVSDVIVSINDLSNGLIFSSEIVGDNIEIQVDEWMDGSGVVLSDVVIFVSEEGVNKYVEGFRFPESGIYAPIEISSGVLTIPNFNSVTIKQLDEKYIPDTIARVADIPEGFSGSWDDLTDRPFYYETEIIEAVYFNGQPANGDSTKIRLPVDMLDVAKSFEADDYVHIECPTVLHLEIDGVNYRCKAKKQAYKRNNASGGNIYLIFGNTDLVPDDGRTYYTNNNNEPNTEPFSVKFTVAVSNGVVSTGGTANLYHIEAGKTCSFRLSYESNTILTLDEKYIPDSIARKSDMLTEADIEELLSLL